MVSGNGRLRVGVVGLGRLWETRHKPSLTRMADRFQVTAVYDQVFRRAEIEAAHLRCAACEGLRALLDRPDVDIVYLLTRQWFGIHPARLAVECGKPVYCAFPLIDNLEQLEWMADRVEHAGAIVMLEFPRRLYPATARLRALLENELGPPRLILGLTRMNAFDRYAMPGPTTQIAPAPLLVDPGSYLLDWCRAIFGALPESLGRVASRVLASALPGAEESDFETISAQFPGGAQAHLAFGLYHRSTWGEAAQFLPPQGFQVYAERGAAWLEMPERLVWSSGSGINEERLQMAPGVGDLLNDQFYRVVTERISPTPSLRDTLELARLIRGLRQQQQPPA